jgi:hypothetical protein
MDGKIIMDDILPDEAGGPGKGLALPGDDETVTRSPTLFMNGQKYSGQRTPEAYKQALCARFETVPAEYATNLSSTAAASMGSCCESQGSLFFLL